MIKELLLPLLLLPLILLLLPLLLPCQSASLPRAPLQAMHFYLTPINNILLLINPPHRSRGGL